MFERINFNLKDLVETQLDQIPESYFSSKTTTFCDPAMGGGQFLVQIVARLRSHGHSDKNISKRIFGMEDHISYINYTNNRHAIPGTFLVCNINEFEKQSTQYDVVIGNPPYRNRAQANGGYNMWYRFFKHFSASTKDGGYTIIITPFWHPWAYMTQCPLNGISIKNIRYKNTSTTDYSFVTDYQIKQLVLLNKEHSTRYFDTSSSFCCTIINKVPINGNTEIVQYHAGTKEITLVNFNKVKTLPVSIRKTSRSIHNKLNKFGLVELTVSNETKKENLDKRKLLSDTRCKDMKYKIYHSHEIVRYTSVKSLDYDKWKCMISRSSSIKNAFVSNNCNQTSDVRYKTFDSREEAELFNDYLHTEFMALVFLFYRFGKNMWFVIPDIDYKHNWTSDMLYDHFGLTKREVRYLKNS